MFNTNENWVAPCLIFFFFFTTDRVIFKTFYCEVILDLKKSYKNSTESIHFLPSFLLCSHLTLSKSGNYCGMILTNIYFRFHQLPHYSPFSVPGSHFAFSCQVSFVSSNLWQFPSLSGSLMTLTLEEYQFGFVWCFLGAWIGVMHYQGDHRDAVVLLLVLLLSVTWLRWCLAVFSTVTYWFSFCYYFWVHLHPSVLIPALLTSGAGSFFVVGLFCAQ